MFCYHCFTNNNIVDYYYSYIIIMTSILNNKGLIHLDSQRCREMLRVACRKHSRATQTYSFRTVQRQDTHKHTHTHTHTMMYILIY